MMSKTRDGKVSREHLYLGGEGGVGTWGGTWGG